MMRLTRRNFSTGVITKDGARLNVPTKLLINGKFVKSKSGKTFATYDPSTGKEITKIYEA
jgi:hypothetical protein